MLTCLRVARRRRTSSLAISQTAGVRTAAGGRIVGHPTKRIRAAAALDSSSPEAGYLEWLKGAGLRFKAASPQNWIGGDVPFPMNPSFKPPAPISNALRSRIYDLYMQDPNANDVRSLATRFGISLKRVDAILRLKGLEKHWEKKKPLQTDFMVGMEKLLKVNQKAASDNISTESLGSNILGSDTAESDLQDETKDVNPSRDRYVRLFWEPVVEGQTPVMPDILERSRLESEHRINAIANSKSHPRVLGRFAHNPPKVQIVPSGSTPNSPTIQFVDVGGKFIDLKDHAQRLKESERRRRNKEKRNPSAGRKLGTAHWKPFYLRTQAESNG